MSERTFEEISRAFSEKGLVGVMDAQGGVPLSPRCARSLQKKVVIEEQLKKRLGNRTDEASGVELRTSPRKKTTQV